jgi:hypothetical protein
MIGVGVNSHGLEEQNIYQQRISYSSAYVAYRPKLIDEP